MEIYENIHYFNAYQTKTQLEINFSNKFNNFMLMREIKMIIIRPSWTWKFGYGANYQIPYVSNPYNPKSFVEFSMLLTLLQQKIIRNKLNIPCASDLAPLLILILL